MKRCLLGACCVCVFTFVVTSANAEGHTITDLGTLGGAESRAIKINDSGQVVGYSKTVSGETHAFLYDGGAMQDLGTLGGGNSYTGDINNSGQVVGYSETASGETHAFLYDDGAMQDLGTLGGTKSAGWDINNSGQVVGYSETASGERHAYLYDSGTMQDLGTLGGTTESQAHNINDSGQVVGQSYIRSSPGGDYWLYPEYHAFLYDGNTMRDLGTLGGPRTRAVGINNSGQVVGTSERAEQSRLDTLLYYARHGFLYDGGAMHDLGTLGGTDSFAKGINDNGQVVGYSYLRSSFNEEYGLIEEYHAFLYDGSTMHDLGTLGGAKSVAYSINNSGQVVGWGSTGSRLVAFLYDGSTMLDLCVLTDCTANGWERLSSASSINDRGDIIGYGRRINGETHAFLITESVPSATRKFQVTSYTIKLGDKMQATFGGTAIEAQGIISCIGPDDQRVVAYFLADDSPVPVPTTAHEGKWGPVFLPKELLGRWTDMLRNEKPLYGYINTDHPEWTNVSTSAEPVGEGEE